MPRLYSNNFSTTITTATLNPGDTSVAITSATGIPAIGGDSYCYLTLVDSLSAPTKMEIVKATAVSGTTVTLTRGVEGTTAQTWTAGDFIELRATAESFSTLDGNNIIRYTEQVDLSANPAITRNDGGIQVLTLTQAETITLSMESGESLLLHLVNGLTYTPTFTGVSWAGGTVPALSDNCAISFWKVNTTIYGIYVGDFI